MTITLPAEAIRAADKTLIETLSLSAAITAALEQMLTSGEAHYGLTAGGEPTLIIRLNGDV